MARDRGVIYIDLWADEDWRKLSIGAQWLYMYLLSCASLNLAGIADWRKARVAALSSTLTVKQLDTYVAELEDAFFIVTDEETEEVLIRSYLRHDGVLKSPNLAISAANAFAGAASARIRGVLAHEVQRLHEEFPDGMGKVDPAKPTTVWDSLKTVLKATPIDIKNGSTNPSVNPLPKGSVSTSLTTSTSPSPSTSPKGDSRAVRGTRIPEPFIVTTAMREWAGREAPGVDVNRETTKFVNYWRSATRNATKRDWKGTWENWLMNGYDRSPAAKPTPEQRARRTLTLATDLIDQKAIDE